jgi:hypothetical protein
MRDFTLNAYRVYLQAIKSSYQNILTFAEFFLADPKPESFSLIRHDVDRRAKRALRMARLEQECGVRATYYFRAKSHVFKPEIIKEISNLGHEIGYHYESLSDTNGDVALALEDFEINLKAFREIVPIKTISMHGRPFKPFDNLDMWRDPKKHRLLFDKYGILGEVYLDIDYSGIAYITDTGRNWITTKANIRDRVESGVKLDFNGYDELYNYLVSNPSHQLVFQVHPERWSEHIMDYLLVFCFDSMANLGKVMVNIATDKRHGA